MIDAGVQLEGPRCTFSRPRRAEEAPVRSDYGLDVAGDLIISDQIFRTASAASRGFI